ncbi:hypothetical protein HMF8227_00734 [Saliniradius amylolyticus]|uniref:Glycosyltransferase 2-like domain-containing protein n=1 Tax=Saliniradius amylolyticus TaxID=2183582 RepID=A0A2S2E1U4_9ALTE|nr:glycosyltransferase family 2 protein [Saliniradius amylolyticus]AWL11230.1 hypothetical protein HMF8227_00734 [Saliniradius amylolyticus]
MDNKTIQNARVVVLLATYNGASYLKEQVDSLLEQTLSVEVLARDDGSRDATMDILRSYDDVLLLNDIEGDDFTPDSPAATFYQANYVRNFSILCEYALKHTDAEYIFFCDQDDVWHPDKVELTVEAIRQVEDSEGKNFPVVVHTDLTVVDEKLTPLAQSFREFEGLPHPDEHGLSRALVQNVATGCAMGFNRRLLSLMTPIPPEAVVHDFWFYIGAKLAGKTCYLNKALIDYRQHTGNSIGTISAKERFSYIKPYFYRSLLRFPINLKRTLHQAKALKRVVNGSGLKLSQAQFSQLENMVTLDTMSPISRVRMLRQLFPGRRSIGERLYLSLLLLFLPFISSGQSREKKEAPGNQPRAPHI